MDGVKKVFICPKCKLVAFAYNSCYCSKCHVNMVATAYAENQWANLPSQEKDKAIESCISNAVVSEGPPPVFKATPVNHSYSSSWATLLRSVIYIFLAIDILAALAGGIALIAGGQAVLGLVVLVVGCMMALISAAGIMVFLDMAVDVSRIRQLLEKK